MLLRESSSARGNSTVAWRDLCMTDWTSHSASRSSCVYWCSSVYTAWHRSILPNYVFRLPTSLAAAICALSLEAYWNFLSSTWEIMVNERSRTPALMPGTHCRNTCDKLHQSIFSCALWKRSYSDSRRVQRTRGILFMLNWLYKFTYLLTYYLRNATAKRGSCTTAGISTLSCHSTASSTVCELQGGQKNRTVFWKFVTPVYVDM